ncbi:MAG: hypothetical protein GY877_07890 [Hyphomicrobium sp.]|nr:hypothetical protein [Hyphomicrobium sp.]
MLLWHNQSSSGLKPILRVGPLHWGWITAAQLPGKSLHAGLALWAIGELQNSRVVTLSNITSLRFGLDCNAKYRALAWLEDAGLISVERKAGHAPLVTILEARSGS